MVVTCKIDTTNLNRGLAILQRGYTRRTPAIAVNTAALVVARFTWANMPVVAQTTIDAELQVTTSPAILESGERSKDKSRQHEVINLPQRSVADMIVVARMHSASKYSVLTGNYWPVDIPGHIGAGMKGMPTGMKPYKLGAAGRIAFWDFVREIAERMVKARHSSTGFLKSCWIPAIRALEPFAAKNAGGGGGASIGPGGGENFVEDSGYAIPAREGQLQAVCEIGNSAGTKGINSVLYTKHNDALWRVTPPVLQKAINDEADNTMKHIADIEFARDKSRMLPFGFR